MCERLRECNAAVPEQEQERPKREVMLLRGLNCNAAGDKQSVEVPGVPPTDIETPGRGVPGRRCHAIGPIDSIGA